MNKSICQWRQVNCTCRRNSARRPLPLALLEPIITPFEPSSAPFPRAHTRNSHPVLPLLSSAVCAIDLVVEDNVEIARVLGVGRDRDGALDRVVRLDGDHVAEVEDGFCRVVEGVGEGGWQGRREGETSVEL